MSEVRTSKTPASKGKPSRSTGLPIPALAALVYSRYGFDVLLRRDYAVIFDNKGPLSPLIAGLGVELSRWMNRDDVYAVRLVFFASGCLAVVAVYGLGETTFRSRAAGLFAALSFLGFYAYAEPAADMTPEHRQELVSWIGSRYHREKVGDWWIFAKSDQGIPQ